MVSAKALVEVVEGALNYASEEMGLALRNAAYSPNIKERMDHSCSIFDGRRRLAAQAEHIPVHIGSMALALKQGLEAFEGELEDGDMLIFNNPYISGTHLPDVTLVHPIYYRNKIVAYVANKAHHSDIGGKAPGSMAGDARDIREEGLMIEPVKLVKKGQVDRRILSWIEKNVRVPRVTRGDLRAQIAANLLGRKRIIETIERFSLPFYQYACGQIIKRTERLLRKRLANLPHGRAEAEDYLESTGNREKRVTIRVEIVVEKDKVSFDYEGTSKQVDGPVNAPLGVTLAGVYFAVKSIVYPELPINEGCFKPVKVNVPKGTVLNAIPPAPVAGGNVETSQRNVDTIFKALANLMPDKICAACQGTMNNIAIGGYDNIRRRGWAFYETNGGGYGGRMGLDGESGIHSHMTNTMNTPVEAIEKEYPLRVLSYTLRERSGGAGRWRGGMGLVRSLQLLAENATVSIMAERMRTSPWGMFGGRNGARGICFLVKRNGLKLKLPSKCTVSMEKDDILVLKTPGGGGYGNPLTREPRLIMNDVKRGLITLQDARRWYGVAIDGRGRLA